jgi:hypothetical protein
MKRKRKLAVLVAVLFGSLVLTGAIRAATFQTPVVGWDVMSGGGGHLEQGDLSLDYTIGQPVAGQLGSGDVALCVGFWCGVSVENYIYLPLVLRNV